MDLSTAVGILTFTGTVVTASQVFNAYQIKGMRDDLKEEHKRFITHEHHVECQDKECNITFKGVITKE